MIRLLVENAQEYRSALPETEIFNKFDCSIAITCPEDTLIKEIEEISFFTKACINVVDVSVKNAETKYNMIQVDITEVPVHIAERRSERPFPRKAPAPKKKPTKDTPNSDLTD
jgi:hypothetical protein